MNQFENITVKCPNPEHTKNVKYVCFDESCKEQRLYCHECIKIGKHVTHLQHQEELPFLFEHISRIEKESDDLINRINKQMDLIQNDFFLLIGGIRSEYQISKQQLHNLNLEQINSFLSQSIHFKQFELTIEKLLQELIKEFQDQITKLKNDLNLFALDYYQISKSNIEKSEELFKIGYKLYRDDKYEEAIEIFDQALNFNSNHQLSLVTKAESLKMLHQYNEAIIWADKALQVNSNHYISFYTKADSLRGLNQYNEAILWIDKALQINPKDFYSLFTKADSLRMLEQYTEAIIWAEKALQINPQHCFSLYTKADSLRMLDKYSEAIIWANKALSVNPKHCNSLYTKGNSLRQLKKYKEAMEVIEQSLKINANHFDSLRIKGECLHDQKQYQQALVFYDKALEINSNHQWTQNRKSIVFLTIR
ncbi:unnamed protein product [Paramecium octaurelia]|uniref:Tetratricopeptide repeat protein n=1 Tax=Paramecium octaurelia TaxID=43137 RepID=A0A8S1XT07_PAROT|nr:unnamed protein product [Paramecium octaurelia]